MSATNFSQNQARRTLRANLIAAREAMPAADRAMAEAAIGRHLTALLDELAPTTLGFCWPYRAEADLTAVLQIWFAADAQRRLALPVVEGEQMRFREWQPNSAMALDQFGIPTPQEGAWLSPDLLLIPVNGFDARGYRLGYGGGYFDRALAAWQPRPLCVGVGFEIARVDDLAPQAHDIPMDWIVSEAGIVVQATL